MNDITLSGGLIALASTVLGGAGAIITFLFKLLLDAKDKRLADKDQQILDCATTLKAQQERFDRVITITEESQRVAKEFTTSIQVQLQQAAPPRRGSTRRTQA